MPVIIKSRKHLYTRAPIIFILIGIFALSPILISMIGARISEFTSGQPCHEGNCFWGGFGWLFFLTFPVAGILFMIFFIIVVIDAIRLFR